MLKLDVKLCIPGSKSKSVTPSDTCWTSAFESNSLWVWIVYPSLKLRVRLENQPIFQKEMSASPFATMAFSGEKC